MAFLPELPLLAAFAARSRSTSIRQSATSATRAPIGPSDDLTGTNRALALVVALAATTVLVVLLVDGFRTAYVDVRDVAPASAEVVGQSVFRYWILPFEALSVLLLAALVGAITISRTEAKGD